MDLRFSLIYIPQERVKPLPVLEVNLKILLFDLMPVGIP